jgi:hypothetical protein
MYIYLKTNAESRQHRLYSFVRTKCEKLQISDTLGNLVVELMTIVFALDTSKRGKMKEAMFIICLHYALKINNIHRSLEVLSNELCIETKYISKMEKLFYRIVQEKKDKLPLFDAIFKTIVTKNDTLLNIDSYYAWDLQKIFGFSCEDINVIKKLVKKFEELNHKKMLPNIILAGCIYFYLKQFDDTHCDKLTELFNCSFESINKVVKEIEKAIEHNFK